MSSPPAYDYSDRNFNSYYIKDMDLAPLYKVDVKAIPIGDFLYYDTVFEWLLTETKGQFYIIDCWFATRGAFIVYLEDPEEAMLFKLRWGG